MGNKPIIKDPQAISFMREGGKKLVDIFKVIKTFVRPGVSLKELDQIAREECVKHNSKPAFLNYQGYPAAICTSVNEGVVHCIPDDYKLQEGDLISIDFGLKYKGYYTDSTISLIVGKDINNLKPLIRSVYEALMSGTKQITDNVTVETISAAIEKSLLKDNLTIMRQFVGHGIGQDLHEDPMVPNFVSHDRKVQLPAGSVIAIEPIAGPGAESYITASDGWSIRTADKKPVAHLEHTVAVTKDGYEILTPIKEIIDL